MRVKSVFSNRVSGTWLPVNSAALAMAVLLSSCMSAGPDYEAQAPDTPQSWTQWHGGEAALAATNLREAPAAMSVQQFFSLFNDPVLEQLQTRALAKNYDLQTATLRFAQSRIARSSASAQHAPTLSAQGGVSRQRQSEYGASTRLIDAIAQPENRDQLIAILSDPFSLYQAGFDASWELDLWGRVRRTVEAADAQVSGAEANLRGVQLSILTEVARSYFELRGAQTQLELAHRDIASGEELLELVQARAAGGLSSDLDVAQQQTQLADLRSRLPQLQNAVTRAYNQLSLLLAEPPGSLQEQLVSNTDWKTPPLPDLALGLPSEVAHRRSDILASEAQLREATANIGIAKAELYPRITIGASFGLESINDSDFNDWGARQWNIGPHFTLPIFDQGRRRSNVDLREVQQQQAAINYQQTVLNAWHEIDAALSGYSAEQQRNQQLAKKLRYSREAFSLAQENYRNGLISYMNELDSQRMLLQAQREYADSDSKLAVLLVSIYKSVGGGDFSNPSHTE